MQGAIDFHTHAFPDALAPRAIAALEAEADIKARLDGTVAGLLASMDQAGVAISVVCSIATKPSQFEPILNWSKQVRSERIVPFPSLHPDDPEFAGRVARIKAEGFRGIKMHPFYQGFDLDDERVFPLYEAVADAGLLLAMHTGYDWGFPGVERARPERIVRVLERVPALKLVTTHFGAWNDWDEVERLLIGRPVMMELSLSIEFLGEERARRMLLAHPPDCLLFGTDSPWSDQAESVARLKALGLGEELERRILGENARALLASV